MEFKKVQLTPYMSYNGTIQKDSELKLNQDGYVISSNTFNKYDSTLSNGQQYHAACYEEIRIRYDEIKEKDDVLNSKLRELASSIAELQRKAASLFSIFL